MNLLLDDSAFSPARPTDDVDVIIEAVTSRRYLDVEAKLRSLGFDHDMREKAPKCRWVLGNLTVDIMPTDSGFLGLIRPGSRKRWLPRLVHEFVHTRLRLISPVALLATKHVAFIDPRRWRLLRQSRRGRFPHRD